jgi:hypothetical protein
VEFLRDKSTISRSKACLERFHRLSNLLHKATNPVGKEPERVNVRIFLAAYMIVAYPTNVFENMGALEQQLLASAHELIKLFEKILYSFQSDKTIPFHKLLKDLTKSFPSALFDYHGDFKAWKVPDEAKLVTRIKHALVALYQARKQLPPDEPEDSQLNTEFRTQICRLRQKLQQIVGVNALRVRRLRSILEERGPRPTGDGVGSTATNVNAVGRRDSLHSQGALRSPGRWALLSPAALLGIAVVPPRARGPTSPGQPTPSLCSESRAGPGRLNHDHRFEFGMSRKRSVGLLGPGN